MVFKKENVGNQPGALVIEILYGKCIGNDRLYSNRTVRGNYAIHFILLERCKQIVGIARKYKLLLVCDDVYNLTYFTDKPPRRFYSYDTRFL